MEKDWSDKGENYVYYQELSEPWELTPGMWKIQLSHKDRILVTKTFHVVDNEI
ncbi:MAG: DUF3859 domain-containing protein [Proteobacteria bacterium]|nr:DUF3859 domain-containing protein [Pseudomonadota bacterium]